MPVSEAADAAAEAEAAVAAAEEEAEEEEEEEEDDEEEAEEDAIPAGGLWEGAAPRRPLKHAESGRALRCAQEGCRGKSTVGNRQLVACVPLSWLGRSLG